MTLNCNQSTCVRMNSMKYQQRFQSCYQNNITKLCISTVQWVKQLLDLETEQVINLWRQYTANGSPSRVFSCTRKSGYWTRLKAADTVITRPNNLPKFGALNLNAYPTTHQLLWTCTYVHNIFISKHFSLFYLKRFKAYLHKSGWNTHMNERVMIVANIFQLSQTNW